MSQRHSSLNLIGSRKKVLAFFVRIILTMLPLIGVSSWQQANAQDWQRAFRNYQEVIEGKKKLEQLTPQERQEVFNVHRRIQAAQADSGASSDCRDAKSRAQSAASELASYARRLRNCAEAQDYSDDCSSEFRRTRSAHGDYEDAVSSVNSYCR
jgi:hypothetical protein